MIDWANIFKIRIANPDDSFSTSRGSKVNNCNETIKKSIQETKT